MKAVRAFFSRLFRPTTPAENSPRTTPTTPYEERYRVVVSYVWLKAKPSFNATALDFIPRDATVRVIGDEEVFVDGYIWRKVNYHGMIGWVRTLDVRNWRHFMELIPPETKV